MARIKISNWLLPLLVLVVVLQAGQLRADFGLPTTLMGGNLIVRDANGINGVLNALDRTFRRFNPQNGRFAKASEAISQIALNVTELGRSVAGGVIKAAGDRTTPVEELFGKLQEKYGRMNRYLTSDVQDEIDALNRSVGNGQTMVLRSALDSVSEAVSQVTTVTADVETVVAKIHESSSGTNTIFKAVDKSSIPADLTTSLSKALTNTKDQLTGLARTIENMLKNIGTTNGFLAKFDQTRQATEKNIMGNQQGMKTFILGERDTTVKRYTNTRNAIIADLSGAIGKLTVFNTNESLLALYDKHSEEYTKIYYYLYNRNESDIQNISSSFDSIDSNLERIVLDSTDTVTGQTQQTVAKLAELYLGRSANSETCYNKFNGQVTNSFPGYQNGVAACINREKTRLGRLTDVMDRMLQMILSTSQDLAANIGSCSVWNGFDRSEIVYRQAEACLNTNLIEMAKFAPLIGRELDLVESLGNLEVEASRYRLYDCVATRNGEALANIYVMNQDIDKCVNVSEVDGAQRDLLPESEREATEESAGAVTTTDVPEYDEYLMEVFGNSSVRADVDNIF